MVTVPVLPPSVPEPAVEFDVLIAMMVESLVVQFAATFDVKETALPVPPLLVMLIVFVVVQESHVMVTVWAPTDTLSVPDTPL